MGTRLQIKGARIAFPHLFEAVAYKGDPEGHKRYGAQLILDPNTQKAEVAKVIKAIEDAAKETWPSDPGGMLKSLKAKGSVCLRDGNSKRNEQTGEVLQGYADMLVLSANSSGKKPAPKVFGKNPKAQGPNHNEDGSLIADDGTVYAGCYVNAIVEIYGQKEHGGKINCQICGVQYAEKGEAFGGGRPADSSEFDNLGGEETEGGSTTDASGFF